MKELIITPPEGYVIDEERSTIYNIVFKKKDELPATWEEFCKNYPKQSKEYYINADSNIFTTTQVGNRCIGIDRTLLPSRKTAEAHLALIQLHRLRDVYRQGWVPNYNEVLSVKYAIKFVNNALFVIRTNTTISNFLTFQSEEIAEQFLKNFKDLIMKAKELI